jgi:hypothetical protein
LATLAELVSRGESLAETASLFANGWKKLGRNCFEKLLQERIEQVESEHVGSRKIRAKTFHTPLGSVEVRRRIYDTPAGPRVAADEVLGLPESAWLPEVLELACVLGVDTEFPNAQALFQRWTGVQACEKTVANQVEATGQKLRAVEESRPAKEIAPRDSALAKVVAFPRPKPRIYVQADGILTPMNQKKGFREARVGVVFKESERWKVSPKRTEIRRKEYVATLEKRGVFGERLYLFYAQTVGTVPHETIVLGDGANWIWEMADLHYPDAVQILDFWHVAEYVWAVARAGLAADEQKAWAEERLDLLKASRWRDVISNAKALTSGKAELKEAQANLERYLTNNASRIDYASYIARGFMIGSGVIESSNRRVVARRLKQAGMHWSEYGAEGVMNLRAAYLSSGSRWKDFWGYKAA